VELARDSVDRTQDLYDDFKKYFVQPWRRNAPVHYKGTAYGAPRNATVNFVFYPKYSDRLKAHSLHLEARLNGRKVLERAGITCVTDLLHFDFNDYWERKLVLRKAASVRGGRREARVLYAAEGRHSQRLMLRTKKVVPAGPQRDKAFVKQKLTWASEGWKVVVKRYRLPEIDDGSDAAHRQVEPLPTDIAVRLLRMGE
jgi:hypothetical protein